ncbi:MAG: hypothetical protein ABW133_15730, partial [Polyangiaceae bacterium]
AHHHDEPQKASTLVKMVMMADILVTIMEGRMMPPQVVVPPLEPAPVITQNLAAVSAPPPAPEIKDEPAKEETTLAQAVADAAREEAPGPTDPGAPLGPTSAIWPTSFANPPGAPSVKPELVARSESIDPARVELENVEFERLATLGMSREIADGILAKLDESIADLPI